MSLLRLSGINARKVLGFTVSAAMLGSLLVAGGLGTGSAAADVQTGTTFSIFAGDGTGNASTQANRLVTPIAEPTSVTTDGLGNVYILAYGNRRVMKVKPNGDATFFAGTGVIGTPVAGAATSSPLDHPSQIAADTSGNVYIVDDNAHMLLKVTPGGVLSIVTSSGNVSAVATAPNDDVYYYDNGDVPALHKISGGSDVVMDTDFADTFPTVVGLAVDRHGNVFLSDPAGPDLLWLAPGQTSATSIKHTGSGRQLALDGSGALYYIANADLTVQKISTPAAGGPQTSVKVAGQNWHANPEPPNVSSGAALTSDLSNPQGLAVDPAGNMYIGEADTNLIVQLASAAPSAPLNLVTTAGNTEVTLAFDQPASVPTAITGYQYSIDDGVSWTGLSGAVDTSMTSTVTGLTNGTDYHFLVRALTALGEGAPSSVSSTVTPATVPLAPGMPSAVAGNGYADLTFDAPTDNGGSAVTSYEWNTFPIVGPWTAFTATASSGRLIGVATPLANGAPYDLVLRAVNSAGPSPESDTASVTLPAGVPGAPTGLTATPGNTSAGLSFTAPASDGGDPITSYQYSTNGTDWVTFTATGTPLTGTATGLTNGTAYVFRVRAVNSIGDGLGAPSTAATSITPRTVPDPPTGLSVVPGNTTAALTFTPPLNNGGAAITGYKVSIDGINWTTFTTVVAGSTRTATVTGLTNTVTYPVTVRAVNVAGSSDPSNSVDVIPVPTVPGAPTSLTASRGDTTVSLSFTTPADDGGSAVTGYKYSIDGGGTWAAFTTTGDPSVTGTVTGLTNGTAYVFRVQAVNITGGGAASSPASSVTPATVPDAPTALTVSPANVSAGLSFTAPVGNGGSAVTSYQYRVDSGSWTTFTTAGSAPLTGTVPSLTNGVSYSIAVRAVNAIGGGAASDPGTVSPATTPSAPGSLTATPGNGHVDLAFTVPTDDGTQAISGYQYSINGGANWTGFIPGGTTPLTTTVSGLTNGTAYTFLVRAGNTMGGGATASVTSTPVTLPGVPGSFTVTPGDTVANLSFTVPADGGSTILRYEVKVDTGAWATLTTAGSGPTLTGTVTALTNGGSFSIVVRAVNAVGEGDATSAASVTPAAAPGGPTGLGATAGNASAVLVFTTPADNGSAITGYQYSPNGADWTTFTTTAVTTTRTGTVTGLTNGTAYIFQVRAMNLAGPGLASLGASVTPMTTPGTPTDLAGTAGNHQVVLTFTVPGTGGSAITGYQISRDSGTFATVTTTLSGSTRTATVTGLTNGTSYTFVVQAVNIVGNGSSSSLVTVIPATVPDQPTGLSGTGGDTSVNLAFTAPADNGGATITSYQYTTNGTTWVTFTTTGSTARTGTVTGLTNGSAYVFAVRAVNSAGNSAPSPDSASVTARTTAGAPTALLAVAGNGQAALSFSAPSDNGGSAVTGYEVSLNSGSWTTLTTVGTLSLTATLTGLTNGTVYAVRVRAITAAGNGAASAPTSVTPVTLPSAPTVTVTPGNQLAHLTFTVPADGGSAITGYQVTTDAGGTWVALTGYTVSGSTVTATVTGLVNGFTYSVQVRTVTGFGTSADSTISAVTPALPPVIPTPTPTPTPSAPGAPSVPTAVPGTASVTVSWSAPSPSTGVNGYTVSANPGPATCSTSSVAATSCVIGAVSGTSYTYTVVAHGDGGDSPSSGPSAAVSALVPVIPETVPETAPTTLTTTDGVLTEVVPSQPVTVVGTGFAPYSTAKVVIYSDPIVLGTVVTDATGSFSVSVVVPAGLDKGAHNFVATGVDPAGIERVMRMPVTLVADTSPFARAPGQVKVAIGNNKVTVSFARAITRPGLTVTGYQVSVDGGKHWKALSAKGSPRLSGSVTGLHNGTGYLVRVRAVTRAGVGTASASIKAKPLLPWFHDPINAAGRKAQVAVPASPKSYHGKLRTTKATYRAHNGTLAVPISWAKGHRLDDGQAVTLTGDGLFTFDSAVITPTGGRQIKALVASLTGDKALTCEGYTDYAGSSSHEKTLSLRRAKAVCAALKADGAKLTTTTVGYGGARPVIIGGTASQRAGNRRVVILVTR